MKKYTELINYLPLRKVDDSVVLWFVRSLLSSCSCFISSCLQKMGERLGFLINYPVDLTFVFPEDTGERKTSMDETFLCWAATNDLSAVSKQQTLKWRLCTFPPIALPHFWTWPKWAINDKYRPSMSQKLLELNALPHQLSTQNCDKLSRFSELPVHACWWFRSRTNTSIPH